jgi:glutamate---cysteine ligase / carboxylate-amine ligase
MPTLSLSEGFGVELEYAIVDRATCAVRPIADQLLVGSDGEPVTDRSEGVIGWSNELTRHLVEFKNEEPTANLRGLAKEFQASVHSANARLEPLGACLMPTGMHPLFTPKLAELWPHSGNAIYALYDGLFDCRRHGWANVQSAHLNLSFNGDEEFARLHSAVRLVLPLIPALAASSPFAEGKFTGFLDYRLEVYRTNSAKVPAITGQVIPELMLSYDQYQRELLEPLYAAMASRDPDGVLRHEWLNARGAIARFDRSAVEVRLVDTQECPRADLAVAGLIARVIGALAHEQLSPQRTQRGFATERLADLLRLTVKSADRALIADGEYLQALGLTDTPRTAGSVWSELYARTVPDSPEEEREVLQLLFEHGPLARRLLAAVGERPSTEELVALCQRLVTCLATGTLFRPQVRR